MQAECGGNDEECEEEQKPDGPEDSRNRRTGIRGSAVRYGTYGMVWYGTLMTVLAQNAGNRLKVTIGPTIPRRPFSVHIQALLRTRGHLDTHSVSPRLWEGLPFREDFGHGKPPRLQPAYSYPCIPAGNIYFRYIPRIHYCEVHRNTQTGNSPRWLPVFGPVDADWSQAEALARPRNFPILTVPYRNWSEVPRALALLLFFFCLPS